MYFLGVDGGGTKTNFMVINEEGKIISFITTGTCHYIQLGFEKTYQVLKDGINSVCEKAGITISDLNYSFLGLPAYGEIIHGTRRLEEIVNQIFKTVGRFKCGNDVEAGWAGSLACQPGINLVAGTGTIGYGVDQNGNTARASGWGYFCGDEGSAYWLGKKLIFTFSKEADGRIEKTALYNIVRDNFNLKRDLDFISVLYNDLERKRDRIAGLAILLYKAAQAGDQKAINIFREAAYEHSLTIKAIISKLDFTREEKILVSYSGGVFNAGSYILKPLKEYLTEEGVKFVEPLLKPVTGAAFYALQQVIELKDYSKIVTRLRKEEKVAL